MQNIPTERLLLSLEVNALYTNIPQEEGIEAWREALNTWHIPDCPTDDVVYLTSLNLRKMKFSFNGKITYKNMKQRWAIGWLHSLPTFYGQVREKRFTLGTIQTHHLVKVHRRHICRLDTRQEKIDKIHRWYQVIINACHTTIKFTVEWSRESITFLDIKIIRYKIRLVTDLYTKPRETHQYLHRRGNHPFHSKTGIAYSVALRLQRVCSKSTDYEPHVEELLRYLINRVYDGELIQQQIDKATNTEREELLISRPKTPAK